MRKTLFEHEKDRSVLILHEKIYQQLSPALQSAFNEVDLHERGLKVRDDPSAGILYYQFMDDLEAGRWSTRKVS